MLLREWPLAAFTVLGQTVVGVFLVAVLPLYLFPVRPGETGTRNMRLLLLVVVVGVLAAAAAVSFFHLGRPFRAVNALNNLRSSWLSREILSELVFMGGLGILAGLEILGHGETPAVRIVAGFAAAAGILFLFSMIRLYMLPTVPAWSGPYTPLSFVLTAALTGTLAAHFIRTDPRWLAAALVFFATAAAAAALFSPESGLFGWRATPSLRPPSPAFQAVFFLRLVLLGLGGLAVSLPLFIHKIPWPGRLVTAALALAIMAETLGRLLFYSAVGSYSR